MNTTIALVAIGITSAALIGYHSKRRFVYTAYNPALNAALAAENVTQNIGGNGLNGKSENVETPPPPTVDAPKDNPFDVPRDGLTYETANNPLYR